MHEANILEEENGITERRTEFFILKNPSLLVMMHKLEITHLDSQFPGWMVSAGSFITLLVNWACLISKLLRHTKWFYSFPSQNRPVLSCRLFCLVWWFIHCKCVKGMIFRHRHLYMHFSNYMAAVNQDLVYIKHQNLFKVWKQNIFMKLIQQTFKNKPSTGLCPDHSLGHCICWLAEST